MTRFMLDTDRNCVVAATGIAALLVFPAVADPVIDVARKSDGSYQLTLEVQEAIDVGEGQQLLLPTAIEICDGLVPQFGRYDFRTLESVEGPTSTDSFVLVQDIECGRAEPVEDKPPSRELGDLERLEIEKVAQGRTLAYLKAEADGDDGAALAMLSDDSPLASDEDWRRQQADFRAEAGQLGEIDVWQVTVYVDPPHAPEPGIYVATDLEVSYENLTVCGYFIWLEDPDGTLRITRQDLGKITPDFVSRMSDSQLAKVRSDFRCRPDAGVAVRGGINRACPKWRFDERSEQRQPRNVHPTPVEAGR